MAEPEQSSTDVVMIVEAIGSPFLTNEEPSAAENTEQPKKRPIKNKKEALEEIILSHIGAGKTTTTAADRQRILNAKTTPWRSVFACWPRDPNGKYITRENSELGKMAPNRAQIWGATLFNFYSVRRIPDLHNLVTFSSGSKLAAWMKANGEDYAKSELEFAEQEPDPYLVHPYPITELIQDTDALIDEKSWVRDDQYDDLSGKGKGKAREYWQVPKPVRSLTAFLHLLMPVIQWPPVSPFDTLAYPKPWPIQPFTINYPKLQKYIFYRDLPRILKVHDPWNLLRAAPRRDLEEEKDEQCSDGEEKDEQWSDKTDVVLDYRLKTSTRHSARRTEDNKLAEAAEAKRKAVYDTFIADPHTRNEPPSGFVHPETIHFDPGPVKPPIFIAFPFRPSISGTREAHLYLSPSGTIGAGHHSYVYNAEFELPRSTIMDDELCEKCIMEDVYRTLREQDGPNGERRDPKWDEKVGRYVVKEAGQPGRVLSLENNDFGEAEYLIEDCTLHHVLEYDGPYRLIHSKIGYQCLERAPYCEHIAKSSKGIHPLTAKVKVAAKLSIEHDNHLAHEAETYQAFPRHFFQHWSGFNIIKPIKEPTPVGPLVPQFYGYYVPDRDPEQSDSDDGWSETSENSRYLSSILLLEDCGKPIVPDSLTIDDQ